MLSLCDGKHERYAWCQVLNNWTWSCDEKAGSLCTAHKQFPSLRNSQNVARQVLDAVSLLWDYLAMVLTGAMMHGAFKDHHCMKVLNFETERSQSQDMKTVKFYCLIDTQGEPKVIFPMVWNELWWLPASRKHSELHSTMLLLCY